MPNHDAATQAKIDTLMKKIGSLWTGVLDATPGKDLAEAIRDRKPLGELKDESIATLALVVTNYEKNLGKELEALAAKGAAEVKPATSEPNGTKTIVPEKETEVLPAKAKK